MPLDHTEKINRYLFNTMPEAEKKIFESEINQNENLAKEVEVQKEMIDLIGLIDTKNKIDTVQYVENPQEKPEVKKRIFPVYFLAAASLLLLIGSLFILNNTNNNPYKNIANQHYHTYLISDDRSTKEVNALDTRDKAVRSYQQANYKDAIPHLKQIMDIEPVYQIMLGISYYETNAYTLAMQHFKVLIDDKDLLYLNEARWYAALSQLQMNEPDLATQNLSDILNDDNVAKKLQLNAENLLSAINDL